MQIEELLTETTLQSLAGPRSFGLGTEYFQQGAVTRVSEYNNSLQGTVMGTEQYDVEVRAEGARVRWQCSCPYGREGHFCKHVVALGLAWLSGGDVAGSPAPAPLTEQELRDKLESLSVQELSALLLEFAAVDLELREQLVFRLELAASSGKNIRDVAKLLERALSSFEGQKRRITWDSIDRLDTAVQMMEPLANSKDAAQVTSLCQNAIERVHVQLAACADWPDDHKLYKCLAGLRELHRLACANSRPDQQKLAKWLFVQLSNDVFPMFDDAHDHYAEVLGTAGIQEYERLVDEALRKQELLDNAYNSGGWHLKELKISMLRARKDWDGLIELLSRELSGSGNYTPIAEVCIEAGRTKDAMAWLRKGIKKESRYGHPSSTYRLIDLLLESGDTGKAVAHAWRLYKERVWAESYKFLKETAIRAGEWPGEWKEKAFALARQKVAAEEKGSRDTLRGNLAAAHLVQLHLEEGETEAAWQAGRGKKLEEDVKLELALARAKTHPADAVPVIWGMAVDALEPAVPSAYRDGISLLKRLKPIVERAGQAAVFPRMLQELREVHYRRRAFLRLLDESGLDK